MWRGAHFSAFLGSEFVMVTPINTLVATAWPFNSAGSNCHCCSAAIAICASTSSGHRVQIVQLAVLGDDSSQKDAPRGRKRGIDRTLCRNLLNGKGWREE